MQIFVSRNQQQRGPFSLKAVQAALDAGKLKGSDLAWYEGAPGWIGLSQVPGIHVPQGQTVPPPPPYQPASVQSPQIMVPNTPSASSDSGHLKQQMSRQDKFSPIDGEHILSEGLSGYLKSAMNVISCDGYLTNHRLVLCSKMPSLGAQVLLGPIAYVAGLVKKSTKIALQVPVDEMSSITKGKHGFANKYTVRTKSGETYTLQFPDRWETPISSLGIRIT